MRNRMLMISLIIAGAACTDQAVPTATESTDARPSLVLASEYWIQDLGTLGGTNSGASDLNADGVVVGWSDTKDGERRAFRWSKGSVMEDLGTLPKFSGSSAAGINSDGFIVGSSSRNGETRAVAWTASGTMIDLGHLDYPGWTWASAVNDAGIIVGSSLRDINPGGIDIVTTHGFRRLPNGSELILSPNLDQSFANDINNRNFIVGAAGPVGSEHAYLWSLSGAAVDLGTLGGAWSEALAISNNGVVVGISETMLPGAPVHGFRWTGAGGMVDLGLVNEYWYANDVNSFGRIVGNRNAGITDGSHGYTYLPAGFAFLQGLALRKDRNAAAVNVCGWIAGQAETMSGPRHAVLWTKADCDA